MEAAAKQAGAGMLLSVGAGQVGLRAVCNHPRAWHCLFFRSDRDAMKHHIRISSTIFGICLKYFLLSRQEMLSTVRLDVLIWQMHLGVLSHKRPITVVLSGFFFKICLGVFGDPSLLQVSPFSIISFPVLGWLNFRA